MAQGRGLIAKRNAQLKVELARKKIKEELVSVSGDGVFGK